MSLRVIIWIVLAVAAGIGLLARQQWSFFLVYVLTILSLFVHFSFVPLLGFALALLVVPFQVAAWIVMVANFLFSATVVWVHLTLRSDFLQDPSRVPPLGGVTEAPSQSVDDLQEAIRRNPQLPDAYYGMGALPNASYFDSASYYEKGVKLDVHRNKAFFSHHWAFALKAAQAQYRGPCIDAFSRASIVDPGRYVAGRASIDASNRFARAAWDCAKEEPQDAALLFPTNQASESNEKQPSTLIRRDGPSELAPSQSGVEVQAPPSTGDKYVDSCFQCNFKEDSETRNWDNLDDLKDIPSLYNAGQKPKALQLAEAALAKYPDYDFVYGWLGRIREGLQYPDEPERSYHEGLRHSRSKASLCANLAMAAFEKGVLADAVTWWVKACAVLMGGGKAKDAYPFLNLAYIAEGLRLIGPNKQLLAWTEAIQSGGLMFDADGANQRYRLANSQGNESIKKAIELLCSFPPYAQSMATQHPRDPKAEEMKRLGDELLKELFKK